METATSSASTVAVIWDYVFSILIWISDVMFRWIPAAVSVIFGLPAPDGTYASSIDTSTGQAGDTLGGTGVGITSGAVDVHGGALPASSYTYGDTALSPGVQTVGAAGDSGAVLETVTSSSSFITSFWSVAAPIGLFFTLLFATFVVYLVIRLWQMRRAEAEHTQIVERASDMPVEKTPQQKRWERIQALAGSEHESDWRLAILEADIMLDELLDAQGYMGDTMADKFRQIEPSDFTTLQYAQEAHGVRNRIAHKGSRHELNQREAQRVIALYQAVFREFYLV